ncbi:MAG TPA: AAA family ATPase [Phycisphaerae bacterium]|nr:AAA family ATPase [Phycisphaerae bacterium]
MADGREIAEMSTPDETGPRKGIRLNRLKVRNFKVLDDLELELPPPELPGDPDVLVLGSRNGLGKTSVLDSCALLFLSAAVSGWPETDWNLVLGKPEMPLDLIDLIVRAGHDEARIEGEIETDGATYSLDVSVYRAGRRLFARGDSGAFARTLRERQPQSWLQDPYKAARGFFYALAGGSPDPLLYPPLLYFHSYRKVAEGNAELGKMVVQGASIAPVQPPSPWSQPVSALKLTLLRSMMGQKGLLEGVTDTEANETIEKLNELMREYAGGTIEKLRPSSDNSIEFRISYGNEGESFTFDGLSSGQKEIISTFFLIWLHTHSSPGIILIDEPELHLNAEWQVGLIRRLYELVPGNQLIIATHAQDVFASVEPSRRVILEVSRGSVRGGN